MSEYPELQGYEVPADEISQKDLATRERELLGEVGAAELVGSAPETIDTDALSDVEPIVEGGADALESDGAEGAPRAPGAGPSAYMPQKVDLSQSEFLKEWKAKRDQEIEEKDKASSEKRESTREKAHKSIDDFYDNYNSKKEKEVEITRKAAEEFAKKRDAEIGSGKGTAWDRIADLMDGLGRPAEGVAPKDKKRFAELVQSLKGDANAPGAAGY